MENENAPERKEDMQIIINKRARDVLHDLGFKCTPAVLQQLNERVHAMLIRASQRCAGNGRKMVFPRDL